MISSLAFLRPKTGTLDLLPAPACCLALLILVPEVITASQPTEPAPLRQEELDELAPFTAPEGVSEEQFAEWVELAGGLNARSRQTLLNSGRSAMPAIVNAMLTIDYGTKRGSRKGRDCHRLLAELVGQETPSRWVLTTVPEEAVANHELILDWYLKCERSIDDDEEWWRLCGFEPGPLLTALGATGLPDGMVRDFLELQDGIEEARAKFQLERAQAEERLEKLEIEGERELRIALAESLPESWEAGGAQVLSPEMVARQLQGELELTWPLGLYESLRDTLRTADRKAVQNQRTMKVEGLSEEIEVSVKTFGDSQYAVVPLVRTWPEARDICRANGGHLACIGSPEELEVVTLLIKAVNFRSSPVLEASETDQFFWLGASDAEVEGTWTWTDGRPVDPELWLQPVRDADGKVAKLPFTLGDDVRQPSNNGDMEHRAVLMQYEPTHAPESNYGKRWGLMDWYSGFPGRFICEWGPEPFDGPWQGQTQRIMEPYLLEYFRSRADLEDRIELERQEETKALDRTRKRALSTVKSMAKDLSRELRRRVRSERLTMTERQIFAAEQLC